jgi:hypothetical protein
MAGKEACSEEVRTEYLLVTDKPEGKRSIGRPYIIIIIIIIINNRII